MKVFRRAVAAMAGVAAAAVLTLGFATSAQADGAYHASGSCPSTTLCAYYLGSGGGGFITFADTQTNWSTAAPHVFPDGSTIDNNSESWENHGTGGYKPDVTMFDNHGYTGTHLCLANDGVIYTYGAYADIFSSNEWADGCVS